MSPEMLIPLVIGLIIGVVSTSLLSRRRKVVFPRPGSPNDPSPKKRLTQHELRHELLAQAADLPHVLSRAEYEQWLDHTVLARLGRGDSALGEARTILNDIAPKDGSGGSKDLQLVIEALDKAQLAYQYSALKFNIMYRPAVGGRPVMNAILWDSRRSAS